MMTDFYLMGQKRHSSSFEESFWFSLGHAQNVFFLMRSKWKDTNTKRDKERTYKDRIMIADSTNWVQYTAQRRLSKKHNYEYQIWIWICVRIWVYRSSHSSCYLRICGDRISSTSIIRLQTVGTSFLGARLNFSLKKSRPLCELVDNCPLFACCVGGTVCGYFPSLSESKDRCPNRSSSRMFALALRCLFADVFSFELCELWESFENKYHDNNKNIALIERTVVTKHNGQNKQYIYKWKS